LIDSKGIDRFRESGNGTAIERRGALSLSDHGASAIFIANEVRDESPGKRERDYR